MAKAHYMGAYLAGTTSLNLFIYYFQFDKYHVSGEKNIYQCFSLTSYEAVCCLSDVIVVVEEQVIISAFAGGAEADTCPEGTGVEVGTGHESSGVSGNCIETQPMSVF